MLFRSAEFLFLRLVGSGAVNHVATAGGALGEFHKLCIFHGCFLSGLAACRGVDDEKKSVGPENGTGSTLFTIGIRFLL